MIIATAYDVIINHFIIPKKGNNSKGRKYEHTGEVNNKVTKKEYEPDQKDGNEMKQNGNTTNTISDPENGAKIIDVDRKSNVDQSSAESTEKKIKPGNIPLFISLYWVTGFRFAFLKANSIESLKYKYFNYVPYMLLPASFLYQLYANFKITLN